MLGTCSRHVPRPDRYAGAADRIDQRAYDARQRPKKPAVAGIVEQRSVHLSLPAIKNPAEA